jgi:hypothetical protein
MWEERKVLVPPDFTGTAAWWLPVQLAMLKPQVVPDEALYDIQKDGILRGAHKRVIQQRHVLDHGKPVG